MSLVLAKGPVAATTADSRYTYNNNNNNYQFPVGSVAVDLHTDSSSADSFGDPRSHPGLTHLQHQHQRKLSEELSRHEEQQQQYNSRLVNISRNNSVSSSSSSLVCASPSVSSHHRSMPSAFGVYDSSE
ncbi:unnamed protein product, partial [Candidula unifasciata]